MILLLCNVVVSGEVSIQPPSVAGGGRAGLCSLSRRGGGRGTQVSGSQTLSETEESGELSGEDRREYDHLGPSPTRSQTG